jgi:V/A-type H+-transporting ATPase subunit I
MPATTKLKKPKMFRPFELYIKMFGLTAYNEFDPTIFVPSLMPFIFGAMFGELDKDIAFYRCFFSIPV